MTTGRINQIAFSSTRDVAYYSLTLAIRTLSLVMVPRRVRIHVNSHIRRKLHLRVDRLSRLGNIIRDQRAHSNCSHHSALNHSTSTHSPVDFPVTHTHIQGEITLRTESASRDTVCSQWNTGRTTGGQLSATKLAKPLVSTVSCRGNTIAHTFQAYNGNGRRRILLDDGFQCTWSRVANWGAPVVTQGTLTQRVASEAVSVEHRRDETIS